MPLSETELEILRLVATGATNREIARERTISEATVKKHVTNINAKLGTANRTEAMRRALELGLVTVGTPDDGAGARDRDTARHLAAELERSRRRSRRMVLGLAIGATVLAATLGGLGVAWLGTRPAAATVVPASSPVEESPPWLVGVDLPTAVSGAACAAFPDEDAVYVMSGRDPDGLARSTMRYRSVELRWQRLADKPTPVSGASAVALQGRLLVPGGCGPDGGAVRTVEIYDPARDRWQQAASLPVPVCAYGLVVWEGDAFLFGGRSGEDAATATDGVWRYRPDEDVWQPEGEMPLPRADLAAVADGNRVRLLGGRDRSGRLQTSHWTYRPFGSVEDRWDLDSAPALPQPRAGLGALSTPIGSVLAVGGGWDVALRDGTIALGRDGSWLPDARLPGFTPQRGACIVLSDNRWAVILGGEVDGRLLNRHYRREVVAGTIFVPAR